MYPDRLIRERERHEFTGVPQSTWYEQIAAGLAPPPIKLGKSAAAYPQSELSALNAARIAGKPEDEIRRLVQRLVAARASAFDRFEAAPD
jgi:prophage regulatory protein